MTDKEILLKEIKTLSDSVRAKTQALKLGLSDRNKFLEETFKPIVDPLNKMKESLKASNEEIKKKLDTNKVSFKREPSSSDISDQTSETIEKSTDNEMEGEEMEKSQTDDTHEEISEESPTNLSILSQNIPEQGPLTRKYILKMLHSGKRPSRYHVYGARLEKEGLIIGNSPLEIDKTDNIIVNGQSFKGTRGLFELLFKPDPKKYSKHDLNNFKRICTLTSTHRKGYSNNAPVHRNKSIKYKDIISKLFSSYRGKQKKGSGLSMKSVYDTNVIYYRDVNKLVERMRLLHQSIQAGHNGLDNEMIALTEELKSRGYISDSQSNHERGQVWSS